jgi:hypothetical protein
MKRIFRHTFRDIFNGNQDEYSKDSLQEDYRH